jgi:hypothetical protein
MFGAHAPAATPGHFAPFVAVIVPVQTLPSEASCGSMTPLDEEDVVIPLELDDVVVPIGASVSGTQSSA